MQIFPRSLNKLPLLLGGGAAAGLVGAIFVVWYWFSPYYTQVGYEPVQPVPYSHRLHAGQLGMDCRYCHANVERSAVAMVPPTETCMNCHSVVRKDSNLLKPIRDSWASGEPMQWVRVHKLPDYVFFDHSAHVTAGVGCVECHGRVDQEEVVRLQKPLSMGWCLECHRDVKQNQLASNYLRPPDKITTMDWQRSANDKWELPASRTPLNPPENCWGCHR